MLSEMLRKIGHSWAVGDAEDAMVGNIVELMGWIALITVVVVGSTAMGVPALSQPVVKLVVVYYTIKGVYKGTKKFFEIKAKLDGWLARLCGVTWWSVVWEGGMPLLSLVAIYLLLWKLRSVLGQQFGFSFWGWLWHTLVG